MKGGRKGTGCRETKRSRVRRRDGVGCGSRGGREERREKREERREKREERREKHTSNIN
jgi:hypothetical protein